MILEYTTICNTGVAEIQCASDITALQHITAILQHITEHYSILVAPAVRIQNILTTVTVYDFCYFRYFQLSFNSPPHSPPPKHFRFARISGVDHMTVGGGQLPPVAPPPPWRR